MRRGLVTLITLASGNYAALAMAFLTSLIVARALGVKQFGDLALFVAIAQILAFAPNATAGALIRFGAQEIAAGGRIAPVLWARTIIVAPIYVAVALVWALLIAPVARASGSSETTLWLVLAYFATLTGFATGAALLQALGRMREYGAALFIDKAAAFAFAGAATAIFEPRPDAVLLAFVSADLVATAWVFVRLGRTAVAPVPIGHAEVAAMLRFSAPLVLASSLGLFGAQWIDYLMVDAFRGRQDLGLYSLSYQLAAVAQQVVIVIGALLLPRYAALLAAGRAADVRVIVSRWIPYWLHGFGIVLGLGLLLAPSVIPVVFGQAFAGAVRPLQILLVASLFLAMSSAFTALLTADGALWPLVLVVLVSVTANISLNFVLIPAIGIEGAAVATLVAYAFSACAFLSYAARRFGFPATPSALVPLPLAGFAIMAAGAVVAGVVVLAFGLAAAFMTLGAPRRADLALVGPNDAAAARQGQTTIRGSGSGRM